MRLEGKTAVVVGAGQQAGDTIGNGRAMALLFAREGEPGDSFVPGDAEPIEKLADALKMTLEAMGQAGAADEHGQLLAACVKFLDGWAG